jgi:hypothetical protein
MFAFPDDSNLDRLSEIRIVRSSSPTVPHMRLLLVPLNP